MTLSSMIRLLVLAAGALAGTLPVATAEAQGTAAPGGGADLPVASDVRLAGDATRTRFVLDVSKQVDPSAFTLADPYRVVVDLPQIAFNLPAKVGETGREHQQPNHRAKGQRISPTLAPRILP